MPQSSGDKLDPYEILAPLDADAMGDVYSAAKRGSGREVVIKADAGSEKVAASAGINRFQKETPA